ncbi:MAG: hypothetical protein UDG86_14030 [Lachnospiraceae bacterium]|nr:hypothetical protein [Lachnospiraceae bacterium]
MRKISKNSTGIIFFFTFLVIFTLCSSTINVNAANTKWKKACKAYRSYLAKNESKFKVVEGNFRHTNKESYKKAASFLITDLDKNGIPELITWYNVAYKQNYAFIYTYKNKRVVRVKDFNGKLSSIKAFCNAAGNYTIYACNKNHLHVDWNGGFLGYRNDVYHMKKGKLKLYAEGNEDKLINKRTFTVNGRKISRKKYLSVVGKCNVKSNGYLISNNKKNRKKCI